MFIIFVFLPASFDILNREKNANEIAIDFPESVMNILTFNRFDSLTGVPSAQRTVAFEKACVLFNLGALHTQIGTRLERGTGDGLDGSVDNFLRAAAVFRFIVDNFTNAPSMDLAPQVLEAFILLMIVIILVPSVSFQS